jgi:hypothetical protein
LQETAGRWPFESTIGDAFPSCAAVSGFKSLQIVRSPNRGVERIYRMYEGQILYDGWMDYGPMFAAVGRSNDGSDAAHDPADFV